MKRYLLFAGDNYYPSGGWSDFIGSFDTVEQALARQCDIRRDWYHVVDTSTMTMIPKLDTPTEPA